MGRILCLLAALLTLLVGCTTSKGEGGDPALSDDLPAWASVPPDDPGFCYGVGCDAELDRAKQKAIINAGQVFSSEISASLAVHTVVDGERFDKVVLGVNRQLTNEQLIGAKFVDQYQDGEGEYWVLSRAPIDCVLDVTEGVLLSYRLEEDAKQLSAVAAVMDQIETRIAAKAVSYDRGGAAVYGAPRALIIPNASFEDPAVTISAGDGRGLRVGEWRIGSTWFGRFQWPGGVPEGERAVWSSIFINGSDASQGMNPDNGFYQVLEQRFEPGKYNLSAKASGDNSAGLTSRLTLGYAAGPERFVPLEYSDLEIRYDTDSERLPQLDDWQNQELTLDIPEGSPAVGRPIWIKLSSLTDSTGPGGGNSNWWDDVRLDYRPRLMSYAALKASGPETYRVASETITIDGDASDWDRIPVYYQDEIGDASYSGTDLHYVKSAMDEELAYFLFVCADEAWGSELTLEINFDYAPGKLAESHRGDTTDLHTNIREREANFWQNTSHRGTPHDPGVRLRRRNEIIEFSVPLKRYDADYFAIVYANIWRQGDSKPADYSDVEFQN